MERILRALLVDSLIMRAMGELLLAVLLLAEELAAEQETACRVEVVTFAEVEGRMRWMGPGTRKILDMLSEWEARGRGCCCCGWN